MEHDDDMLTFKSHNRAISASFESWQAMEGVTNLEKAVAAAQKAIDVASLANAVVAAFRVAEPGALTASYSSARRSEAARLDQLRLTR